MELRGIVHENVSWIQLIQLKWSKLLLSKWNLN